MVVTYIETLVRISDGYQGSVTVLVLGLRTDQFAKYWLLRPRIVGQAFHRVSFRCKEVEGNTGLLHHFGLRCFLQRRTSKGFRRVGECFSFIVEWGLVLRFRINLRQCAGCQAFYDDTVSWFKLKFWQSQLSRWQLSSTLSLSKEKLNRFMICLDHEAGSLQVMHVMINKFPILLRASYCAR